MTTLHWARVKKKLQDIYYENNVSCCQELKRNINNKTNCQKRYLLFHIEKFTTPIFTYTIFEKEIGFFNNIPTRKRVLEKHKKLEEKKSLGNSVVKRLVKLYANKFWSAGHYKVSSVNMSPSCHIIETADSANVRRRFE